MTRAGIIWLLAGLLVVGTVGAPVSADDKDGNDRTLRATLKGFEEPPSVSSTGRGTFRATISEDGTALSYTISYEDLEGDVPEGTPACPGPRAGTVSRTVTGADIVGPAGQGLTTGEFAELLRAIDKNVTYANVHSSKHTGGEIRGQIERED